MGIVRIIKMGNHGKCDYNILSEGRKCGKPATHKVLNDFVAGNEYCQQHIKVVKKRIPGVKVRLIE